MKKNRKNGLLLRGSQRILITQRLSGVLSLAFLLFAGASVGSPKTGYGNGSIFPSGVQKQVTNSKTTQGLKEPESGSFVASQQSKVVVKGKVTATDGSPLPGVTVSVKGTTTGTVTDADGNYQLTISRSVKALLFSYVGMKTQSVELKGLRVINVTLSSDTQDINEVVVVGYGTQKKATITGSISTISVKDLQQASTPSLSNTLGGKLPGLVTRQSMGEPGYDQAQVYIRGFGTWVNRSPLILVDGVERDMNNINAEEIESFSVLKDASATAVYGVRGANGVILINTKHGIKGKPKVVFRTETAVLTSLRLPEYIDGADYANLVNEGLANVGKASRYTDADLKLFRDGTDPYFHPNVNWTDVVLRKHTSQTVNNLSVSGGSDIARYYINVGYTQQSGIYKEDDLNKYNTNDEVDRYNFRSNIDVDVSSRLSLNLGIGGIIQKGHYPGNSSYTIFDAINRTTPIMFPVKNPDGTPGGVLAFMGCNPWGEVTQSGYSRQDRSTLQGTFGAKWDLSSLITQGLSLNGKFSFDRYAETDANRSKSFAVKQYMGKDPTSGDDIYQTYREESPLGYSIGNAANQATYTEVSANYARTFGKHEVTGMILGNRREYIDLTAGNSTDNLPQRRQGIAGRATYGYDNRYLAEFDFGYNGSENFPHGKQYGFFPSVSAGWIVSNEKFWDTPFISNLKLRGSYGKVGNDQIGGARFLFLTKMNKNGGSYPFGDGQVWYGGFDEQSTGNLNITWESSDKADLGMDLSFLKNDLTLQVDVFKERRYNILWQRQQIPSYAGYPGSAVPYGNLGKANNHGLDGLLEYKHTTENGLFYSLRGTFSFTNNKIIENDEPVKKYPYLSAKGHPIDQPWGYVALGIFQNQAEIDNSPRQTFMSVVRPGDIKYKDLNGDGVIDSYDQQAIGYPRTPEIMFGFGGTVAYSGFDLSIYFTGAARSSVFLDGSSMWPFQDNLGSWNVRTEYYNNRWTKDNPNAKYPAVIDGNNPNNYQQSTLYMRNGAYLRIKNAEVGYTIPKSIMSRLKVGSARFFVNGMNLYTWDHVKIMDPEADNGVGVYPLQWSVNFGLQVNF